MNKKAKKICANCRNEFYCDISCQILNWDHHKKDCIGKDIMLCLVDGEEVTEINYKLYNLKFINWVECKIPHRLEIPLVAKKVGPSGKSNERDLAVYFFADPVTGLAPLDWSSLECKKLGKIVLTRKDYMNFNKQDFFDLYSFIYHLMDYYSDNLIEVIQREKLNRKEFLIYKENENQYQKEYVHYF